MKNETVILKKGNHTFCTKYMNASFLCADDVGGIHPEISNMHNSNQILFYIQNSVQDLRAENS